MKAIMSIKKFSMIFCVLLGCVWTTDVLGQAIANFSQSRVDAVTWVENHFQKGETPPFLVCLRRQALERLPPKVAVFGGAEG